MRSWEIDFWYEYALFRCCFRAICIIRIHVAAFGTLIPIMLAGDNQFSPKGVVLLLAAAITLIGIVLHIIGIMISYSQKSNLEQSNSGKLIERAKIKMTENIHRQIDIEGIATNLGTSYSWFWKVFKESVVSAKSFSRFK